MHKVTQLEYKTDTNIISRLQIIDCIAMDYARLLQQMVANSYYFTTASTKVYVIN